jgi:hypothetical protein
VFSPKLSASISAKFSVAALAAVVSADVKNLSVYRPVITALEMMVRTIKPQLA